MGSRETTSEPKKQQPDQQKDTTSNKKHNNQKQAKKQEQVEIQQKQENQYDLCVFLVVVFFFGPEAIFRMGSLGDHLAANMGSRAQEIDRLVSCCLLCFRFVFCCVLAGGGRFWGLLGPSWGHLGTILRPIFHTSGRYRFHLFQMAGVGRLHFGALSLARRALEMRLHLFCYIQFIQT